MSDEGPGGDTSWWCKLHTCSRSVWENSTGPFSSLTVAATTASALDVSCLGVGWGNAAWGASFVVILNRSVIAVCGEKENQTHHVTSTKLPSYKLSPLLVIFLMFNPPADLQLSNTTQNCDNNISFTISNFCNFNDRFNFEEVNCFGKNWFKRYQPLVNEDWQIQSRHLNNKIKLTFLKKAVVKLPPSMDTSAKSRFWFAFLMMFSSTVMSLINLIKVIIKETKR